MVPVGIGLDRLRDLPVEGEGLVEVPAHQGLEHIAVEPLGGGSGLDVEGIQAVEGALEADAQAPALGRVRVGIGQVVEVRWQDRLPVHGDAVSRSVDGPGWQAAGRDREAEGQNRSAPGQFPANRSGSHAATLVKGPGAVMARKRDLFAPHGGEISHRALRRWNCPGEADKRPVNLSPYSRKKRRLSRRSRCPAWPTFSASCFLRMSCDGCHWREIV